MTTHEPQGTRKRTGIPKHRVCIRVRVKVFKNNNDHSNGDGDDDGGGGGGGGAAAADDDNKKT